MGFEMLPKGYSDEKETALKIRIQNYVHYRRRNENGIPCDKYYAVDTEEYPTENGEKYECNYLEVQHILKTGRFKRIKKGDNYRPRVYP